MRNIFRWVPFSVLVVVLCVGDMALYAQPTDGEVHVNGKSDPHDQESTASDDLEKPWNQGVSMANRNAARELFLEGNRLFRIPLPARAAIKYGAALALWQHPAFYFNLALAQINLNQEVEALESLMRAINYGEKPLGAEQFEEAQKQVEQLKRQLGRIRLTCRTPGAEVTLNGTVVIIGPGSYEGWVKARSHVLTAKKEGYQSEARRVTFSAAGYIEIDLTLVTLNQAANISRRWAVWKPWAIIGTGIALAATGGGLHAFAARNFNDYDRRFLMLSCASQPDRETPGCTRDDIGSTLNNQLSMARRQQAIAVGAYMTAGAAITMGAILLSLNRPRLAGHMSDQRHRSLVAVPAISANMFGILVSVNN